MRTAIPRRFRRRLLVVMLALGLLPLAVWGGASHALGRRVLALRPTQLEALLEQVDARLGSAGADASLRQDLALARLNLLQAELARRSLARLTPRLLLLTLLASAGLIAVAALVLGRQIARPLEQLAEGMTRYARGDLGFRLGETGRAHDELALVVHQFNRMGDELAAQRARLEVSEAIAAWQGVARALAHEIKNPLTPMRLAIARLRRPAPPATREAAAEEERKGEALELLERQVDTLLRLAQSFSAFAKLPAPELRATALRPLLEDACALYRETSPVAVECAAPDVVVSADAGLLGRALGNLVKNAVEASQPGGAAVKVGAEIADRHVRIEIADRGCGIAEALSGAALARSLGSTKAEGSGLGLPISHRIVHEHGGSLSLAPREGGGTLATVILPLPESEDR